MVITSLKNENNNILYVWFPRLAITTFLNLPIRRLERVFHICGIKKINYRRYFAVPFVSDAKRKSFLADVANSVNWI